MNYNDQEQVLIRKFYKNYDWRRVNLDKLMGWHREKVKSDVVLAIALQCRISKITVRDVAKKLGRPDYFIGSVLNGMLLYHLKNRRDVCATGKYAAAVMVHRNLVISIGTNRIDLMFYKLAIVKSGKLLGRFYNWNKLSPRASLSA